MQKKLKTTLIQEAWDRGEEGEARRLEDALREKFNPIVQRFNEGLITCEDLMLLLNYYDQEE